MFSGPESLSGMRPEASAAAGHVREAAGSDPAAPAMDVVTGYPWVHVF